MSRTEPTRRQQHALDLVAQGFRAGRPSSVRELAVQMGIRSPNAVLDHLRALERKGYLTHDPTSPARLAYRPTERLPPLSAAWLLGQAVRLHDAVDQHYGRSALAVGGPWWRLVVATGGWSANEQAVESADPTWHRLTLQAQIRGGLWVWAWGPVPDDVGGALGPVSVGPWGSPAPVGPPGSEAPRPPAG